MRRRTVASRFVENARAQNWIVTKEIGIFCESQFLFARESALSRAISEIFTRENALPVIARRRDYNALATSARCLREMRMQEKRNNSNAEADVGGCEDERLFASISYLPYFQTRRSLFLARLAGISPCYGRPIEIYHLLVLLESPRRNSTARRVHNISLRELWNCINDEEPGFAAEHPSKRLN